MVFLCQHCGDPEGQSAIMEVMGGGKETLVSTIKQHGIEVPPNKTLDMNGSLYIVISYGTLSHSLVVGWLR